MADEEKDATRAGFVAVMGAPNAGKSTLVNRLVGGKVTIVTHKVQTTRFAIRGVMVRGPAQVVLVDTPGVFAPRRRLDRAMVRAAWDGAAGADLVAHVVDAAAEDLARNGGGKAADAKAAEDAARVTEGLLAAKKEGACDAVLVLNKVDMLARERLLALAQAFHDTGAYTDVLMISAQKGDGVEDLADLFAARMPLGPWLYPEEQIADLPERLLAAEITREKVFLRLHEELPYHATVETDAWTVGKDSSVRIDQTLYVERASQRKIALGKGGSAIKSIGQAAREELEQLLERRVHLFLHVKVRERWMDDRARYQAMGLDFAD